MAAAAGVGFVQGQTTALDPVMARLPKIAGTKTLALGGVLALANDMLIKNRFLGYAADAVLMVGSFEAGRGGLKGKPRAGQPALQGDDDISGEL